MVISSAGGLVPFELGRDHRAPGRALGPNGSGPTVVRAQRPRHLLPDERRASSRILEIRPEGHFVTYGLRVPLMRMRDPEVSRARVPTA